jgi:hypothetical protein
MIQVNGLIVDARHLPRDIQEEAYRKGLIPYIPGDRADNSTEERTMSHTKSKSGPPRFQVGNKVPRRS